MIAAVCCPGPSLPARWAGRWGYDVVWAVNRALLVVPDAGWLSAGDIGLYQGLLGDVRPHFGVLTTDDTAAMIRDTDWGSLAVVGWRQVPVIEDHQRIRPVNWSVQAALCHACQLGATRIDLYGCDGAASGTRIDCTGYPGENRGPDRWAREELDLIETTKLLAGRGTTITRIDR